MPEGAIFYAVVTFQFSFRWSLKFSFNLEMCTEALYHNIALVVPYADIRSLANFSACIFIDCSFGVTGGFVRAFFDGPPNRRCLFSSSLTAGFASEERDGSPWSILVGMLMMSEQCFLERECLRPAFDPLQSA